MPYPAGVFRFNINASLRDGEVMVHTVWMRRDANTFADTVTLQNLTDRVRDEWAKTISGGAGAPPGISQKLAATTRYTSVTGYAVDAFGKATDQAQASFGSTVTGNTSTGFPPQVAIVVSLLTGRPGRSGRGRLYLGGLSFDAMATTGRIDLVSRDLITNALAGFYVRLRDIDSTGDTHRPVVVSPTRGESFKITSVAVGDVFDTMRSRRNRLVEAKFSAVVDPS